MDVGGMGGVISAIDGGLSWLVHCLHMLGLCLGPGDMVAAKS